MSRSKGAAAEREVKNLLKGFGVDCERNLSQTRDGGHDLAGLPVALEVKRQESLQFKPWIEQAIRQGEEVGLTPALAWRQNRQPWRIAVFYTLEEFAELCRRELFALKAKRQESLQFKAWIDQTIKQAEESGLRAALAWRQNHKPWRVAVFYTMEEFAELCRRENEHD